ncbi:hypothetical protein BDF19DRAFT_435629 [Syncephalis fuscata]|nr:hypothetical protein BDF19DRAFT_435629 [Syncephalis fuscata]
MHFSLLPTIIILGCLFATIIINVNSVASLPTQSGRRERSDELRKAAIINGSSPSTSNPAIDDLKRIMPSDKYFKKDGFYVYPEEWFGYSNKWAIAHGYYAASASVYGQPGYAEEVAVYITCTNSLKLYNLLATGRKLMQMHWQKYPIEIPGTGRRGIATLQSFQPDPQYACNVFLY